MNYVDHCTEQNVSERDMVDAILLPRCQVPIPKEPVVFNKFASSIINPGADIESLAVSSEMDFEVPSCHRAVIALISRCAGQVEMVIVVGKGGKNISEEDAMSYVCRSEHKCDLLKLCLRWLDTQWHTT